MAREKTFEERRREREREEAENDPQQEQSLKEKRASTITAPSLKELAGDGSTQKLLELIARAEPLIDQVHNLYNQYLAGIESRPPIERRKHLDQVMQTIQAMNKPTPAYQFRFNTLNSSYLTHRDRWDRLAKDLESGKIKRTTGPKRGG